MASEIPIDLVMRVNDEMSATLDKVVVAADKATKSFDNMSSKSSQVSDALTKAAPALGKVSTEFSSVANAAKIASGITWDETVNKWRGANARFVSSQEAINKGFTDADKELYKYKRNADDAKNSTDKLAKSMRDGGEQSSGFSVKLAALGNVAGDLAMKAISAVGGAVGGLFHEMIRGNAEMQTYETQFGVLLKSTDKAKERIKELAEFGLRTPFELPEIIRADKVMQSFGFHSEESAKKFGMTGSQIREMAGDMAAGTGQSFEYMSGYLGRFASGATGEAIMRFSELGITSREELQKMGIQFEKSGAMITPVAEAFKILSKVINDKFGGMMKKQSETFDGMVSNLNDWRNTTLRELGKPLFDALAVQLGRVLEFLNKPETVAAITSVVLAMKSAVESLVKFIESNWPAIQSIITSVFDAISVAWNSVLKPALEAVISIFESVADQTLFYFNEMSGSIETVMTFIGDMIDSVLLDILDLWENNGAEILAFVKETWLSISSIVTGVIEIIVRLIETNMPFIQEKINAAMTTVKIIFETVWGAIKIVVGTTIDLIKGIINFFLAAVNNDTEAAGDALKNMFESIWGRIKDTVEKWLTDVYDDINEYLGKSGTSVEEEMTNISNSISTWWTKASNDVEFFVNTIANRTKGKFQEIRDDVSAAFNQMVENVKNAFETFMRYYNTIAPYLGLGYTTMATQGYGNINTYQGVLPTNNTSYTADINMIVYGNDASASERGTVNALRRAGFSVVR
jgi:phage-related protein